MPQPSLNFNEINKNSFSKMITKNKEFKKFQLEPLNVSQPLSPRLPPVETLISPLSSRRKRS